MKRLIQFGVAAIVVVIAFVIALPFFVSSESVRANLVERAYAMTGLEMTFSGRPTVSFTPFLGIEIENVVFRKPDGNPDRLPVLSMPVLKAKVQLSSLLTGRVDVNEFQLIRPMLNAMTETDNAGLVIEKGALSNALISAQKLREETPNSSTPDIGLVPMVRIGQIEVIDGVVTFNGNEKTNNGTISNINGLVNWANSRANLVVEGSAIWRGDQIKLSTAVAQPVFLFSGGISKLNAEINSEPITLSFIGEANRFSDLFFSGALEANSPSLHRVINLLGGDTGNSASFSDFKIAGTVAGTLSQLQMEDAKISLDNNKANGSLKFSKATNQTKARLSGTLASDNITVSSYFNSLSAEPQTNKLGSIFEVLSKAELDMRFSSKALAIADIELTDFAGSLISKDGKIKIDMGNANLGPSIMVGSLETAKFNDGLEFEGDLDVAKLDLSTVEMVQKWSSLRPAGPSSLKLRFKTRGSNQVELANNLDGTVSLQMKQGQLVGLDVKDIQDKTSTNKNPRETMVIGVKNSTTQFDELNFNADLHGGIAWIRDTQFKSPDAQTMLSGKADIRSGNLAIWGSIVDTAAVSNEQAKPDIIDHRFFIGGTVGLPLLVPEPLPRALKVIEPQPTQTDSIASPQKLN